MRAPSSGWEVSCGSSATARSSGGTSRRSSKRRRITAGSPACSRHSSRRSTGATPGLPSWTTSAAWVHSEVFGGFSGTACGERIADSGSHILVTMDGYYRNGELIDHKAKADEAVAKARALGVEVAKVLVWRRHRGQYASKSPMVPGRDFFVDEVLGDYRGRVVEPVSMPAEAPLFLMYTSGTTARPKGCEHSTGGY